MEKNVYISNEITQRVISNETYDIMMICKTNGNYVDAIKEIQEYILKTYYNDSGLYNYLLKTAFDLSGVNHLKSILKNGINDCFRKKMFKNKFNYTSISYVDLIHMLISNITLMQFRTEVEGEYIDLFLIEDGNQVISSEEYAKRLLKKTHNH